MSFHLCSKLLKLVLFGFLLMEEQYDNSKWKLLSAPKYDTVMGRDRFTHNWTISGPQGEHNDCLILHKPINLHKDLF